MAKLDNLRHEWASIISSIVNKAAKNTIWSIIQRLLFGATVYFIWQKRNIGRMQQSSRSEEVFFNYFISNIRLKLLVCTLKYSNDMVKAAEIWNLPLRRDDYYKKMVNDLARS